MLVNVMITGHGNICNVMIVSLIAVAGIVIRVVACIRWNSIIFQTSFHLVDLLLRQSVRLCDIVISY